MEQKRDTWLGLVSWTQASRRRSRTRWLALVAAAALLATWWTLGTARPVEARGSSACEQAVEARGSSACEQAVEARGSSACEQRQAGVPARVVLEPIVIQADSQAVFLSSSAAVR